MSEYQKKTIKIGSKLLDISKPIVMAILNITEDSFYEDSRISTDNELIEKCATFLKEGATIIDLGAMSSRPGAADLGAEHELEKLLPAIHLLKNHFPNIIISVDTYRSKVAKKSIEAGAEMINDISGGQNDDNMAKVIGQLDVPYVMMHMQGMPKLMQKNPVYDNVTRDIYKFFSKQIQIFKQAGVKDIILDPGFGFGKSLEHNYELLENLNHFKYLGLPVLVGLSRKSMIYKPLGVGPEDALNGTTALHMIALRKGAAILRVHDVKEAVELIKINQLF